MLTVLFANIKLMWYCGIKFGIRLKPILPFKSYDTCWMYFWRISTTGVVVDHSFKYVTWVQLKSSHSDWLFWFLLSKLVLKLGCSQLWVLSPMTHVDHALYKYQTTGVADHSLK